MSGIKSRDELLAQVTGADILSAIHHIEEIASFQKLKPSQVAWVLYQQLKKEEENE